MLGGGGTKINCCKVNSSKHLKNEKFPVEKPLLDILLIYFVKA